MHRFIGKESANPLTLVSAAGAAARNSIGLVLVGGMTIGTIFTLFIVPSLYMLIAKEHQERRLDESEAEIEPAAASEPEPVPEYAYPRWLVVLDRGRREFLAPF